MPIDYSRDYNPDFKETSQRVRFEREKGVCQQCGKKHGDMVEIHPDPAQLRLFGYEPKVKRKRVVLTTAHLDHDSRNDEDDNLAAFCATCHLYYDRYDNARRRELGKYYHLVQFVIDFSPVHPTHEFKPKQAPIALYRVHRQPPKNPDPGHVPSAPDP